MTLTLKTFIGLAQLVFLCLDYHKLSGVSNFRQSITKLTDWGKRGRLEVKTANKLLPGINKWLLIWRRQRCALRLAPHSGHAYHVLDVLRNLVHVLHVPSARLRQIASHTTVITAGGLPPCMHCI